MLQMIGTGAPLLVNELFTDSKTIGELNPGILGPQQQVRRRQACIHSVSCRKAWGWSQVDGYLPLPTNTEYKVAWARAISMAHTENLHVYAAMYARPVS